MTFYKIGPQDTLPKTTQDELEKANNSYTATKDFKVYKDEIKKIFSLAEPKITEESKLFLAGFIEGDGSINVRMKKQRTATLGVLLDPEFSVTQHVNGVSNLYLAMCVFQTGRISLKGGSKATLVYRIDNRKSIIEKVLPFFDKYITIYGSPVKKERKDKFSTLLTCFEEKKHLDFNSLTSEMLPIWDDLRMQKGQSNEAFASLTDAITYIRVFVDKKKK